MRIVLLLLLVLQTLYAPKVIHISTVSDSKMHELSSIVLQEAYRKAGLKLEIHQLPSSQALRVADSGIVDGEISRTEDIRQTYKNLLRVPIKINHIAGVVFSRDPKQKILGWVSLEPLRIGIISGCDFAKRGTRGMRVRIYPSSYAALRALKLKRLDAVVMPLVDGLQVLKEHHIEGIYALKPTLVHIPLYHFIHKSHGDIVAKLTHVLRKMQRQGRIRAIRKTYIAQLMQKG